MPHSLAEPKVGSIITLAAVGSEKFAIARVIRGGMGLVFQLVPIDPGLRVMAMKTLQESVPISLFVREAGIWVSLSNHSYISRAIGYGQYAGSPYVVCDWYDRSLSDIDSRQWSANNIETLILSLISGLQYALDKSGVIHQDIKPSNIMIDDADAPRIADFGLARFAKGGFDLPSSIGLLSDGGSSLSFGPFGGTPRYMAPELLAGVTAEPGVHTDIFSLGVTLFEWLTGEHPYFDAVGNIYRNSLRQEPLQRVEKAQGRQIVPVLDLIALAVEYDYRLRPQSYTDLLKRAPVGRRGRSGHVDEVDDVVARATYLRKLGRIEEGLKIISSALNSRPTNPILLNSLAVILITTGKRREACAILQSAFEYLRMSRGVHRSLVYLDPVANLASQLIISEHDYLHAAAVLETSISWISSTDYENETSYFPEFGWYFLWTGDFDQAVKHIKCVYRHRGPDEASLLWLMLAEYLSGSIEDNADELSELVLGFDALTLPMTIAALGVAKYASSKIQTKLVTRAIGTNGSSVRQIAIEAGLGRDGLTPPLCNEAIRTVFRSIDDGFTGGRYFDTIG